MATTFFILKRGLAVAGLSAQPESVRLRYWDFVVEYGLKRKDWELARGLNARGEPLPGVALATRKHRKSAMTPTGRGDPSAPYLMPGRGLSRTRSLLAGKAHADYAEFYWRWDMWTGDQWGKVLAHHARRGKAYDVIGLSPKGIAWVKANAEKAWRAWMAAGQPIEAPAVVSAEPPPIEVVGRTNLDHAVFGMGGDKATTQKAIDEGRSSGFLSAEEWAKHFRSRRPSLAPRSGQAPSVSKGQSNVILQHLWSIPKPPPAAAAVKKAAMPPAAPPRPKVAKPKPAPPPRPPGFVDASDVVRVAEGVKPLVRDGVRVGVRAIEKVHGVAGMPVTVVDEDMNGHDAASGVFRGGLDDGIGLKPYATAPHTFIHEFGHAVDFAAFAGREWRRPGSIHSTDEVRAVWRAMNESRRVVGLVERGYAAERRLFEADPSEDDRERSRVLGYLREPREIWARAYAQWIVDRSGDPDARRAFEANVAIDQTYNAYWWEDDDFAAIAEAFDALFRSIGWLK